MILKTVGWSSFEIEAIIRGDGNTGCVVRRSQNREVGYCQVRAAVRVDGNGKGLATGEAKGRDHAAIFDREVTSHCRF